MPQQCVVLLPRAEHCCSLLYRGLLTHSVIHGRVHGKTSPFAVGPGSRNRAGSPL